MESPSRARAFDRVGDALRMAAVVAFAVALVLGFSTAVAALQRAKNPSAAAERACADVTPPGTADSPDRHECLRREMERPTVSIRDVGTSTVAFGGALVLVATARARDRRRRPHV